MNIQEYISSGIIESYVFGLADPAEREEFERLCAAHPEVREAREAFEISLEQYAMLNQVQPSRNLKSRIFAAIDMEKDQNKDNVNKTGSIQPVLSNTSAAPFKEKAKVTGMSGWQRYLAAAAVILLLISTGLNFYFFDKYKAYNNKYDQLLASQTELASHNQILQTRLLDYEKAIGYMKDPNMAIVKMPANPKGPDPTSLTTVYWDTVSKDVYLAVNQLPQPSGNQQYQLWALVDGKPVDAGVFDISEGPGLVKMKRIRRAQAFAITLEKKGGSPTPTMEKLYVLGKV
ncbi:MAG: anti-sigma factor [Chitinophagaceae bacterium]|nr:anti-sigma factor [Chitinophagaceae bacterium]